MRGAIGVDDAPRGRADVVLDAAEYLFYANGVTAVGVKDVRATSGVSLKQLYSLFPSKEDLVTAYLTRFSQRMLADLRAHLDAAPATRQDRLHALFDWLDTWIHQPGFNGSAFINAHGELGALPASAHQVIAAHIAEKRRLLAESVLLQEEPKPAAGGSAEQECTRTAGCCRGPTIDDLVILVHGAITTATVAGDPDAARRARQMADDLLASRTASG